MRDFLEFQTDCEASLAGLSRRAHLGGEAHAPAGKVLSGGLVLLHVLPDVFHTHLPCCARPQNVPRHSELA